MTQYENMAKIQLEREIVKYQAQLDKTNNVIDRIHGISDYSDEVAKSFHMGRVGFRKDTKKVNATIDKTLRNATAACEQYGIRQEAISIIEHCKKTIAFIDKHTTEETANTTTKKQILKQQRTKSLEDAKPLEWVKVGKDYVYHDFKIRKVDDVVFIYYNEKQINYRKTIKEAKAIVSILITKGFPNKK